jgi:hypothetical protein
MAKIKQFRDASLSLWQSAVDEVVSTRSATFRAQALAAAPGSPPRPDMADRIMREATTYCEAMDTSKALAEIVSGHVAPEALGQTLGYCSITAMKLARAILLGNEEEKQRYSQELGKFGDCDPLYAQAAKKYADYFLLQGKSVPYRVYQSLSDFVIDGRLPAQAKVALVGDWGTGQDAALNVLKQIARKDPDVVIHLGDIYYSGTEFEFENYFLKPWKEILGLEKRSIPTFTLSGNHDMYAGGGPYYAVIDKLGQPASYFCLRNDDWQFIAVDTGLHDHNPLGGGPTLLEETEVVWVKDKLQNAGERKTVLLSHHPLFTAYEDIEGSDINLRLQVQLKDILPKLAMWLWGHEHNLVIYGPYLGLERGRCVGHGAFPVGIDETPAEPRFPDVPLLKQPDGRAIRLDRSDGLYNHGYAMVELDGPAATASYYQDSDEVNPLYQETIA